LEFRLIEWRLEWRSELGMTRITARDKAARKRGIPLGIGRLFQRAGGADGRIEIL
jgi:hypothetical protein